MIEGNEIEGEVSERYAIDWDVYINNKKVEARYGNFYERVEGIYKSGRGPVIELNGLELGDTYNVKVDMHKMDYVAYVFDDNGDPIGFRAVLESKEKVGTLEFVVNNNAYEEEIKYIPINKEYEIENGDKFTLDKFSSTVAGKKFYYKSDFKQKNIYGTQRTIMLLDITDEYGNEVLGHIPGEAKSEGDIRIVDRGDHNEKTDEGKVMMIDEKAKILNVKVKVAILPKELGDNFEEWKVIDEFKLDLSELE